MPLFLVYLSPNGSNVIMTRLSLETDRIFEVSPSVSKCLQVSPNRKI